MDGYLGALGSRAVRDFPAEWSRQYAETWPGPIRFPVSRQAAPGPEFFRPETKPKFRPVSPARDQISKIVRRTGRANAACSRKVSVIRDSGDCVVADAVACRTRLHAKFPANREKNREFHQIRALAAILKADTRANSKAFSQFPYATEQGNFLKEQGICTREQRILNRYSQGDFLDARPLTRIARHRPVAECALRTPSFPPDPR